MLFGPSRLLGFPESKRLMDVGFLLMGLSSGFSFLPVFLGLLHFLV